ncbi:MAG: hypothetical protein JSR19_10795 [Proteobacteria bacterium]|nr:hypothetical protein [Pseudomonadota bacterium]HQR02873.1 hypothetical protein [Rhodocyclaceae bacterium]
MAVTENMESWLAQGMPEDVLRALVPLRHHLYAGADIAPPLEQAARNLLDQRVRLIDAEVRTLLLDTALPLPRRLHVLARTWSEMLGLYFAGMPLGSDTEESSTDSAMATLALDVLLRQLRVNLYAFSSPPQDLWSRIFLVCRAAGEGPVAVTIPAALGALLALGTVRPEQFTPRELAFLAEVAQVEGEAVAISDRPPDATGAANAWFWIDAEQGRSAVALTRRVPSTESRVIYFCCAELGRRIGACIEQLESGTPAAALGYPRLANRPEYLAVLRRARDQWLVPAVRHLPRRRQGDRVRVCVRLGELWEALNRHEVVDADSGSISEWMVLNENAAGFALMHLQGAVRGVVAGGALGIKERDDGHWSVWIVRWVRSDHPEHLELGLELLAPRSRAVHVCHEGGDREMVPALLLSVGSMTHMTEALLVSRGGLGERLGENFSLVDGTDGRVRLSTCRVTALRQQTSSIDVLEFESLRRPATG